MPFQVGSGITECSYQSSDGSLAPHIVNTCAQNKSRGLAEGGQEEEEENEQH